MGQGHLCVSLVASHVLPCQLVEVANWLQGTLQQVLSVGDTLIDAPNGELIRPKVEPISEDIKYRLFDLTIAEGDLHLLEGERIMRLQVLYIFHRWIWSWPLLPLCPPPCRLQGST